jgi:hypothetical protein
MLRKLGEIGAGGEGSFTDELTSEDSDITAESRVACVEDFHFRTAADQEKLFIGDQKRNSEIVAGSFAMAHFTENFFGDREQHIVAARFAADGCDLPDQFRARLRHARLLRDDRLLRAGGRKKLGTSFQGSPFDGGDETVAAARKGFDETRMLVRIAEGAAERLDRCVHAMLEIDEGVGGPEAALQLFSGEQLAGLFEKQGENLEGASGEMDLRTVFAKFARTEINLVGVEAKPTLGRKCIAH